MRPLRTRLRRALDGLKTGQRDLRRWLSNPESARRERRFRQLLAARQWPALRALVRECAELALRDRDRHFLSQLGHAALRLDELKLGAEMLSAEDRLKRPPDERVWRGEDIAGETLVVRFAHERRRGLAAGIGQLGYVREAAQRARRTVLIVAPRLATLIARSLPDIEVVPLGPQSRAFDAPGYISAYLNDLRHVIGYDAATLRRHFSPMVADAEVTERLRTRYTGGATRPVVGISWWSSQTRKDIPALAHWCRLIEQIPATFVSLQYLPRDEDLQALTDAAPERFLFDPGVDQMVDMDLFAAQVGAMDHVISISNTGANLAGAMDVPMVLVRDDSFGPIWPHIEPSVVPWYPSATVVGKDGRDWGQVFEDVIHTAQVRLRAPRNRH